jgi:predicted PurR-regulated permease PerM
VFWVERSVYRGLLLFGATLLAIWAFQLILWPFIAPIAWALCLCAVTARPYRALARWLRRPRLASSVMVLLTAAVILAPMILVGALVIEEARSINFGPMQKNLEENLPGVVEWCDRTLDYFGLGTLDEFLREMQKGLPALASRIFSGSVAEGALSVLMTPVFFLFGLLVTLFTQYFVYREAPRLRRLFVDLSPLDEADTDRVLASLQGTTSAAILGGVVVAIIQGALGGIAFAVAGIQSPIMWSVVMMAFSLLPFGGTALVWVPAGVYLLVTGEAFGGWFVLLWGTAIVGTADNFLRPWVLTKTGARNLHPMLLFFAILSGIGVFGISGIVFGPLLLALLITLIQIYREHQPARAEAPSPA